MSIGSSRVAYLDKRVLTRFVGFHAEYDKIDGSKV